MSIVIVGGGTAGWLTALSARAFLPNAAITLVESSSIGILGSGEGTTPHFVSDFLDLCGIPMAELVREAGATFKNGINFRNWTGDGSEYFHPFFDYVYPVIELPIVHPEQPRPISELTFSGLATRNGRTVLSPPQGNDEHLPRRHGAYAAHFDAHRLADFLRRKAMERGVQRIDAIVQGVLPNPSGQVDRIILDNGSSLGGELFFDCTGFRRLLIGEFLGSKWIDRGNTLPVDSAIPFSLPLDGPRLPQTDAIALESGWAWKIPVEDRFGCGYVFDSQFASDEDARNTIKQHFPEADLTDRVLRFKSGYLDEIWKQNVVSIGVSTGFLEPLEATSIWMSILLLKEFFKSHLPQNDRFARRKFNEYHRTLMERTIDFLYIHYCGGRTDSPFWKSFRQRTTAPPVSAEILEHGYRWPFGEDPRIAGDPAPFPATSWLYIALGLNLFDQRSCRNYWNYFGLDEGYQERLHAHQNHLSQASEQCFHHEAMLQAFLRGQAIP